VVSIRSRTPNLSLVRASEECDDRDLVAGLRANDSNAPGKLFDRYGSLVNKVLLHTLGSSADHDDLVQETFIEVLRSIGSLRDENALRAWITTIAIRVARGELRRRRVRRFFLLASDDVPDVTHEDDHVARDMLRATWKVLNSLSPDERLAFTVRYIHGDELTVVADACGCSLATVKRWLHRAEQRFVALCKQHPELAQRIAQGGRWSLT
jgi:RNA polymerase sigma-70 factor, ECF subfamily